MSHKITGKAEIDFGYWIYENGFDYHNDNSKQTEALKTFFIIEWFESLNLWNTKFYEIFTKYSMGNYKIAVTKTIMELEEIYNSKQ